MNCDEPDTRQRIIDAARDLFIDGGAARMSMRKVAGKVGVSATAIYRHFEHKEALLLAVVEQGFRRFAEYLWSALDEDSPIDRLRGAGVQYAKFALEHRRDYRIMFMTPQDELGYGELVDLAKESVAPQTFQFLVDRVSECIDAGVLRDEDSRALSATIWSHVHGHVSLRLVGQFSAAFPSDDEFLLFFQHSMTRLFSGLAG